MSAVIYDIPICQWSRRRPNSHYKCHCINCIHHIHNLPTGPDGPETFYEWNPFAISAKNKCPRFRTKAQMIIQNNRRGDK